MRGRELRAALLACLTLAFACLLVSGLPRLIAGGEAESPAPGRAALHAAMIGAPAPQTGGEMAQNASSPTRPRVEKPAACAPRIGGGQPVLLRCDANGNVLGHRSYMHTVYRAFALGDGFA